MTTAHRKPLIAGNWKMNLGLKESVELAQAVAQDVGREEGLPEVVLCAPFTALSVLSQALKGSRVQLGAQDMHWEEKGAYTGEVSPTQVLDAGAVHAILGHSERRQHFGETDETVHRKLQAAVRHGVRPIVCIGETLRERESNETHRVLERQTKVALQGFSPAELSRLVLAYEPIWAIGTGKTATPAQAQEAHVFIRQQVAKAVDAGFGQGLRILYGGSVKPENIDALMAEPDLDGALVGGESLKAVGFLRIVRFKTLAPR